MHSLPIEILDIIFSFCNSSTLLSTQNVCHDWQHCISRKEDSWNIVYHPHISIVYSTVDTVYSENMKLFEQCISDWSGVVDPSSHIMYERECVIEPNEQRATVMNEMLKSLGAFDSNTISDSEEVSSSTVSSRFTIRFTNALRAENYQEDYQIVILDENTCSYSRITQISNNHDTIIVYFNRDKNGVVPEELLKCNLIKLIVPYELIEQSKAMGHLLVKLCAYISIQKDSKRLMLNNVSTSHDKNNNYNRLDHVLTVIQQYKDLYTSDENYSRYSQLLSSLNGTSRSWINSSSGHISNWLNTFRKLGWFQWPLSLKLAVLNQVFYNELSKRSSVLIEESYGAFDTVYRVANFGSSKHKYTPLEFTVDSNNSTIRFRYWSYFRDVMTATISYSLIETVIDEGSTVMQSSVLESFDRSCMVDRVINKPIVHMLGFVLKLSGADFMNDDY